MNNHPSAELMQEIAIDLGVDPSFVEKDWYAVQILKLISDYNHGDIEPVFSGGTSLSKGYGLIERFSEDIDFKLKSPTPKNRREYREYRSEIIELIQAQEIFSIDEATIKSQDGSRFFSCDIRYPQNHELNSSLRTNLKLEMRFQDISMQTENREIKSFAAQYTEEDAETNIECITPAETAADKFSALLWRIVTRDNDAQGNDRTMIRHLHDLCALEKLALAHEDFVPTIHTAFESDKGRGGMPHDMSLEDAAAVALRSLQTYKSYKDDYRNFVDAMSYARHEDRITFDMAIESLKRIINTIM